ncbi:MAG: thymidine kinase [Solobacterium sp.]|nr:thymidine kinase [Solobacterium sp.]
MAKLYFFYGAMGSCKTANALMTHYNYTERGQKALLVKADLDVRDGADVIRSRIGLEETCILLSQLQKMTKEELSTCDAIILDEAQFASAEQIDFLSDLVDELGIPVLCYGLRADFRNELFEGSRRLLAIADTIKELKTVCWCGRKATCNARYDENGIVRDGAQVMLGANESYIALCRKHFKEGNLGPKHMIKR